MLPFLNKKRVATTILASRKESGAVEMDATHSASSEPKIAAAQSLIEAINAHDAEGVLNAIKALVGDSE